MRRTADVLENYLPPKRESTHTSSFLTTDEYVVFVAPSVHQIKAFSRVLTPDQAQRILGEQDKLSYSEFCKSESDFSQYLAEDIQ